MDLKRTKMNIPVLLLTGENITIFTQFVKKYSKEDNGWTLRTSGGTMYEKR